MNKLAAITIACFFTAPAMAEVRVDFIEGAPKDRFVVSNLGTCPLKAADVSLDLSGSAAGLIFDVTASGAGVEVFQPFEVVKGEQYLTALPVVRDGDRRIELQIDGLPVGQSVVFTIDVDDTAGEREITVSDSEIRGATVSLRTAQVENTAMFDQSAQAVMPGPDCAV